MKIIKKALVLTGTSCLIFFGAPTANASELGMLFSTQVPIMLVQGSSSFSNAIPGSVTVPTPASGMVPAPGTTAHQLYTAEFNRLIANGHAHTARAQSYAEYLLDLAMDPNRASVWSYLDEGDLPEWHTGERNGGSWISRYMVSADNAEALTARIETLTGQHLESNLPGFGLAMVDKGNLIYIIETFNYDF